MVCVLAAAATADATVLDARSVNSATLSNGLVVIGCADDDATVVSAEVIVRVGAADDPEAALGMAHLLEHLCWVGVPGDDPREAVEQVGGVTYAGTLRDYTRFCATVPAVAGLADPDEALRVALASLGRMVMREQFEEAAVARERQAILEEAEGRQDQPRLVLNDLAFEAVFGRGHPYGRRIEGTRDSLLAAGAGQAGSFHRSWYVPNNMAVIVCGPLAFKAVLSAAEGVFGRLAPQSLPTRASTPAARPATGGERAVRTGTGEAYVMAAFVGPAAAERWQLCASDVLATLLGDPAMSRFRSAISAQGMGVDFLTQRERALFGVWAVCRPTEVVAVRDGIRRELARLAEAGPTPEELTAAKRQIGADYAFANETPADRCATLGFYEAVDGYRAATQYLGRVSAVTAEDVKAVAAWYAGEPAWVALMPEPPAPGADQRSASEGQRP